MFCGSLSSSGWAEHMQRCLQVWARYVLGLQQMPCKGHSTAWCYATGAVPHLLKLHAELQNDLT